uniref:Mannose-6-phosphate receptor (cation dependent) n=1 Tax=Xiphophorus couchianus TaxID=32473 RepID=A0A3B5MZE8_9TELE
MLGSVLLWAILTQLLLCRNGVFAGNGTKACKLQDESASQRKVLERLEPLAGKNFSVTVKEEKESYRYVFQLCGDAGGVQKAGVIQQTDSQAKPTIVGSYTSTKAIGGSKTLQFIKPDFKSETFDYLFCFNFFFLPLRQSDCFYLFELDSSAVCPPVQSQLSAGSIILIIGFCLVAVYLIGGFLYQRLIVGAKGMEQFPNYAFWVEVGNLSADGCDFVCRSKNREEAPAYRGVTADALDEEPEERDDHLLPM